MMDVADPTEATGTGATPLDDLQTLEADDPAGTALKVGRSTRRPPGTPESGEEEVEESGDDIVEQIGNAILDDADGQLDSEQGRQELGSDIDGLEPEDRTSGESAAIDATIEDLDDQDTFEVEVIVVGEETEAIVTEEGETVAANLNDGERSRLIETGDGDQVLLVSEDLETAEAVEEIIDSTVDRVTDVAEENGVVVDVEALRSAITKIANSASERVFYDVAAPQFRFNRVPEIVTDEVTGHRPWDPR